MNSDAEIEFEFPSVIRIYKNGRVERLSKTQIVPPSFDPETCVASKDVVINDSTGVSARIYLPNRPPDDNKKHPIIVYCHGGSFVLGSAFSLHDHAYMNHLASQASAIAVSVEYRLAPENPIPIQYNDTLEALKWVTSHVNGGPEPWLTNYGNFSNVFLIGFSSGGNVAHNVALRDVHFKGLVLIHPYFITNKKPPSVPTNPTTQKLEEIWRYVCPGTSGLDDPRANPEASGAPSLTELNCDRVMVCVAKDSLMGREEEYYEALKASGWGTNAELLESIGQKHGFFLEKPYSEAEHEMMARLLAFINRG